MTSTNRVFLVTRRGFTAILAICLCLSWSCKESEGIPTTLGLLVSNSWKTNSYTFSPPYTGTQNFALGSDDVISFYYHGIISYDYGPYRVPGPQMTYGTWSFSNGDSLVTFKYGPTFVRTMVSLNSKSLVYKSTFTENGITYMVTKHMDAVTKFPQPLEGSCTFTFKGSTWVMSPGVCTADTFEAYFDEAHTSGLLLSAFPPVISLTDSENLDNNFISGALGVPTVTFSGKTWTFSGLIKGTTVNEASAISGTCTCSN